MPGRFVGHAAANVELDTAAECEEEEALKNKRKNN